MRPIFFGLLCSLLLTLLHTPTLYAQSAHSTHANKLPRPNTYEDVRGHIKSKHYINTAFGFSMMIDQAGFKAELSNQAGYKYNFANPNAQADDVVLSINERTHKNTLRFYQSHQEAHHLKTAKEILAYQLSSLNPSVSTRTIAGKEMAYAKIERDDTTDEYYAMLANGYFIKWSITGKTSATQERKALTNIFNSLTFTWSES